MGPLVERRLEPIETKWRPARRRRWPAKGCPRQKRHTVARIPRPAPSPDQPCGPLAGARNTRSCSPSGLPSRCRSPVIRARGQQRRRGGSRGCQRRAGPVPSRQDLAVKWNSSCCEGPATHGRRLVARALNERRGRRGSRGTDCPGLGPAAGPIVQAGWEWRWQHLPS